MGQFESVNGKRLPSKLTLQGDIPRQIDSKTAAEVIDAASSTIKSVTNGSGLLQFLLNLVLGLSLEALWGMLNGQ